jgi:hypothetical protein
MLADSLYASTLAETNPDNVKCLDTRIFPLFKAAVGKASEEGKNTVFATLKNLLWANSAFAIVGDTSEWNTLVSDRPVLDAFINHFEKFFIGDIMWTDTNFRHMTKNHKLYRTWNEIVTNDRFKKSDLPRIGEVIEDLKKRGVPPTLLSGPMNTELVRAIFDYLLDTRMEPIFGENKEEEPELPEQERLSNAFQRYMIGQSYFYARFSPALPELVELGKNLMNHMSELLQESAHHFLNEADRNEIQQQFTKDVMYVWSMGLIPTSEADTYLQIHPIFEPSYVDYYQLPYKSVAETVAAVHPGAN